MTLEGLRAYRDTRQRWVLGFGGGQLLVLACGGVAAFASGFAGFLALAAAWMFIATRISRYVLGDRGLDAEIGQLAKRKVLAGGLHGQVPAEVAEAAASIDEHRRIMLPLPYAMSAVFLLGSASSLLPAAAPWIFGVALVAAIASLGWTWSRRKAWARGRAWVDAWVEVAAPLEPEETVAPPEPPRFTVIEGGREEE